MGGFATDGVRGAQESSRSSDAPASRKPTTSRAPSRPAPGAHAGGTPTAALGPRLDRLSRVQRMIDRSPRQQAAWSLEPGAPAAGPVQRPRSGGRRHGVLPATAGGASVGARRPVAQREGLPSPELGRHRSTSESGAESEAEAEAEAVPIATNHPNARADRVQAELTAINNRLRPGTPSADFIGFLQRGVDCLDHAFDENRRWEIAAAFHRLIDFCSDEQNRHRSRVPEAREMAAEAVRAFRGILADAHPFMDPTPLCEVLGEFLMDIIKHAFVSGQKARKSKAAKVKKKLSPVKRYRERRQKEEFNEKSRVENVKALEEMRDAERDDALGE